MPVFSVWTPGVISTYDEEISRWDMYALATFGERRILHTIEIHETGHGGEMRMSKPASWDVEVPPGARLFASTSGKSVIEIKQFWVGWVVGRRLHMQALMQERPIDTDLEPDEEPIFPAIMDGSGRAALYSWRATGGGAALCRRVFSGDIHKAGSSVVESLSEVPGRPVVSGTGAVPGERSQHVLVGWLEVGAAGPRMVLAVVQPNGVRIERSAPIAGVLPFGHQRLGLWAASLDRVELAAVFAVKDEPSSYNLIRFAIGPDFERGRITASAPVRLEAALHAAAVDYYKSVSEASPVQALLTADRRLFAAYGAGQGTRLVRQGVSLEDPLAVITTYSGVIRPVHRADGTVVLE